MSDTSPDSVVPEAPGGEAQPGGGQSVSELAEAVRRLALSQQDLLEALNRDGRRTPPGPAAEDVRRVVLDVLRERDAARGRTEARDRYVREKLADLPEAYRRLLPDTDDERALAAAERDVRRQFREDLRAVGTGGIDLAGDPAGGGERPGAAVDYSDLSPLQQIALGLKDARPAERPRPAGRPAAGQDGPARRGGDPAIVQGAD